MTCNNPKLDLVNINAYIKFGEILSVCSQDIERKWNYDGRNDGITDGRTTQIQYSPTFSKWGYENNFENVRYRLAVYFMDT